MLTKQGKPRTKNTLGIFLILWFSPSPPLSFIAIKFLEIGVYQLDQKALQTDLYSDIRNENFIRTN